MVLCRPYLIDSRSHDHTLSVGLFILVRPIHGCIPKTSLTMIIYVYTKSTMLVLTLFKTCSVIDYKWLLIIETIKKIICQLIRRLINNTIYSVTYIYNGGFFLTNLFITVHWFISWYQLLIFYLIYLIVLIFCGSEIIYFKCF